MCLNILYDDICLYMFYDVLHTMLLHFYDVIKILYYDIFYGLSSSVRSPWARQHASVSLLQQRGCDQLSANTLGTVRSPEANHGAASGCWEGRHRQPGPHSPGDTLITMFCVIRICRELKLHCSHIHGFKFIGILTKCYPNVHI